MTPRIRGLIKILGSLLVIYLLGRLGLMRLLERHWNDRYRNTDWLWFPLLMVMIVPLVGFMIGLGELATGKPFRVLQSTWGRLKRWQQGLFSAVMLCLIGLLFLLVRLVSAH